MNTLTLDVSVRIRKFCFWPIVLLRVMRLPVPKWMIAVEIVK